MREKTAIVTGPATGIGRSERRYRVVVRDRRRHDAQLRKPLTLAAEMLLLEVRSRGGWRTWLEKHHTSSPGIWLVYYKDARAAGVAYDDSVCEALCFGWVDSLIRRIDDKRYARKFTPRKPASKWSDSNCKRWREMKRSGLLAAAGRAAAPTANRYAPIPRVPELPSYIATAFRRRPKAWKAFTALAPSHRKQYVLWIHTAKRPETRERRIRESIAMLEGGKSLGLK